MEQANMQMLFSQCAFCINDGPNGTCKAFPDGVPLGIRMNKIDHRKPVEGDNGIRFKLDPKMKKHFNKQKPFDQFDK